MENLQQLGIPWNRAPRNIACYRCRHRKKKCDKRRPICGECSRAGADCVPLLPKRSSTANQPSTKYIQLLEDHVATLETRLRTLNPSIATDHLMRQSPVEEHIRCDESENEPVVEAGYPSPSISAMLLRYPQDSPSDALGWFFDGLPDDRVEETMETSHAEDQQITTLQQPPDAIDMFMDYPPVDEPGIPPLEDHERNGSDALISLNLASHNLSESYMCDGVANRYVTEYFTSVHPMWPFLHYKQWDECWGYWAGLRKHTSTNWKEFFVEMVLSVGALLVSGSDPSPDHTSLSKVAYQRAMSKYNLCSAEDTSPTIKTQASLLLTVHAMHLDSVTELCSRASEAIQNCAVSSLVYRQSRQEGRKSTNADSEQVIYQMTLRTCVVIDILLSNSMDHAVCFDSMSVQNEDLDEDESQCVSVEELRLVHPDSQMPPSGLEIALEKHMVWLRQIQYRILRSIGNLEQEALNNVHPTPNLWRSKLKHELDKWIRDIPTIDVSLQRSQRFLSATWLRKLANYTVISLFPNPSLAVRGGDSRHLVKAACSVLITFRRLRVKDHTTCDTWTALLHQFQAAVTVVFCLWATPTHQQAEFYDRRMICESLFAGLATLVDFASKWKPARVFRDTFELLTECVPVTEYGDPSQQWTISPSRSQELKVLIDETEKLKAQPRVVSMLRIMLKGPRPAFVPLSILETQWIQYEYDEDHPEPIR